LSIMFIETWEANLRKSLRKRN